MKPSHSRLRRGKAASASAGGNVTREQALAHALAVQQGAEQALRLVRRRNGGESHDSTSPVSFSGGRFAGRIEEQDPEFGSPTQRLDHPMEIRRQALADLRSPFAMAGWPSRSDRPEGEEQFEAGADPDLPGNADIGVRLLSNIISVNRLYRLDLRPQRVSSKPAAPCALSLGVPTLAAIFPPEFLARLATPCLVVDLAAAERNIARAAEYFAKRKAKLRPHFKAHKCTQLLRRQVDAGSCVGVTCATAYEAELLANKGFQNVLVANEVVGPCRPRRIDACREAHPHDCGARRGRGRPAPGEGRRGGRCFFRRPYRGRCRYGTLRRRLRQQDASRYRRRSKELASPRAARAAGL